jgi:hypothetical protein
MHEEVYFYVDGDRICTPFPQVQYPVAHKQGER